MTATDANGQGQGDGPRRPGATSLPPGGAGILPVVPPPGSDLYNENAQRKNAATAASAAGVRAFTAQAVAFYFRAPVKAFFRTRVDYLAYARSIHLERHPPQPPSQQQQQRQQQGGGGGGGGGRLRQVWAWLRGTTPGVLTSAIRQQGWSVVPDHVLPPLMANVAVGAVLYSSYLHILARLHEESGRGARRVYPPPPPRDTFAAGLLAGSIQSLDAGAGAARGRPRSMWSFSAAKLREIGLRGVFAGWGLSLAKDSVGSAVFFSTFEYIKAQGYYKFVRWYYGGLSDDIVDLLSRRRPSSPPDGSRLSTTDGNPEDNNNNSNNNNNHHHQPTVIRPHYAIEPGFLLLAGVGASVAQQLAAYPLTHLQLEHFDHLEDLDARARRYRSEPPSRRRRGRMWRAYYRAYRETWRRCGAAAAAEGKGLAAWLYRGFWWNTVRQVPSTSAGLIIFELVRRKYGLGGDEVRITKDGYDILLN
ncbi:mitochondrial carrier protein [Gaeumannomyces tritici R3-111a-1]|uniref:Mitochondrial carrier protein n=1 Tax=Gaeumannomyces tritici (strain R3-111a-1) TaxID=644352 RepID=J3NWN1_GAET3|nr:mitochondrial carrier protein [Gaeumannomyces tritici R3-111a-1]EJT75763.1 mitochondrial carrier protein [Gaeumannomyces tritici R3-111a-1]